MRHSVRTARPVAPTCRWTTWNTMSSGLAVPPPMAGRSCDPPGPVSVAAVAAAGRAVSPCVPTPVAG
eukprot:10152485-Lingulodinium_polyedra.AAC.1